VLERGWRFAQPLLLALADGGFGAIALLGLVGQLSLFVSGPVVGATIDRVDRSANAYTNCVLVQRVVCVCVCVFMCAR
jgi:ATP/ADP translocase